MFSLTRRRALIAAAVLSSNVVKGTRKSPRFATGLAFIQTGSSYRTAKILSHSVQQPCRGVLPIFMSTEAEVSSTELVDGSYGDFEEGDFAAAGISEENDSPSAKLHWALTEAVSKALKAISKKNASLQRELDKAQSLEATMSRANLIVSNLYRIPAGAKSVEVEDWDNGGEMVRLELNTKDYSSAQEEADALFAMGRKMKRGSKVVQDLMEGSVEAEELLNDAVMDLEVAGKADDEGMLVLIQERLERTSSKTGFLFTPLANEEGGRSKTKRPDKSQRENQTYRKFTSPSGLKVLVGRNKRQNEAICFKEARQDDVWFHARGVPWSTCIAVRPTRKCQTNGRRFAIRCKSCRLLLRCQNRTPGTGDNRRTQAHPETSGSSSRRSKTPPGGSNSRWKPRGRRRGPQVGQGGIRG